MNHRIKSIMDKLNDEILDTKTIIEAWENVEYVTKKDGKPFKVLSKNFVNANLETEWFGLKDVCNKLVVYTRTPKGKYINDSIDCHFPMSYVDSSFKYKNKPIEKPYNVVNVGNYNEYVFDVEDIKDEVARRITYKKETLESLNKQLDNLEKAYTDFKDGFTNLINKLKVDSNYNSFSTTSYYEIRNDVINSVF